MSPSYGPKIRLSSRPSRHAYNGPCYFGPIVRHASRGSSLTGLRRLKAPRPRVRVQPVRPSLTKGKPNPCASLCHNGHGTDCPARPPAAEARLFKGKVCASSGRLRCHRSNGTTGCGRIGRGACRHAIDTTANARPPILVARAGALIGRQIDAKRSLHIGFRKPLARTFHYLPQGAANPSSCCVDIYNLPIRSRNSGHGHVQSNELTRLSRWCDYAEGRRAPGRTSTPASS